MKICLITTTIYVPEVLKLYRALGPDVKFIVAGDRKTPHHAARELINSLGNATYLSDEDQADLGTAVSEMIGWNKIMRRNLALLEAIKTDADIIITIDDDNIPIGNDYFIEFARLFSKPFNGLAVSTELGWFDVGKLIEPPVPHRGFPYSRRQRHILLNASAIVGARVGVASGLWYGDPDIDATTRISQGPNVYNLSGLLESGLIVRPGCFTTFNSQNTAFLRELAPLMMVLVGVGRYDDIWASYITQRVMMERDEVVHFGKPHVWQQRNQHNLWNNLKDEIYGMEHTDRFIDDLLSADIGKGPVSSQLRRIYAFLSGKTYIPEIVHKVGVAWCDDVERAIEAAAS